MEALTLALVTGMQERRQRAMNLRQTAGTALGRAAGAELWRAEALRALRFEHCVVDAAAATFTNLTLHGLLAHALLARAAAGARPARPRRAAPARRASDPRA
jgi:hypothetical protein